MAGSISAQVTYRRLQDDPRPWKQADARLANLAAVRSTEHGEPRVKRLIEAGRTAEPNWGDDAGDVAAEFGENMSSGLWDLGAAGGIEVAIALRSGAVLFQQWGRGPSLPETSTELGRAAAKTAGEELAFVLAGLAGNALIPEPVLGGLWVSYRLGRTGVRAQRNRKTLRRCLLRRIEALHQQAQASVAHG